MILLLLSLLIATVSAGRRIPPNSNTVAGGRWGTPAASCLDHLSLPLEEGLAGDLEASESQADKTKKVKQVKRGTKGNRMSGVFECVLVSPPEKHLHSFVVFFPFFFCDRARVEKSTAQTRKR